MHFTKVVALAALLTGSAIAAPAAEANPPRPPPPPPSPTNVNQQNACGNNAQPYCCTTDNWGGYVSCYAFVFSSQCSQTTVCCNANNSIQVCLGNANIVVGKFP